MTQSGTLRAYSFSHKNTSLVDRDALAFSSDQIADFIPRAEQKFGGEFAVLSTCNRTEFYHVGRNDEEFWPQLGAFVASFKGIDLDEIGEPDRLDDGEAARHLFRVAASLESVALGENEILGQIKDAHQLLLEAVDSAPVLDELFQYAVRAGKEVRTETALCEGTVSVSSVSVELAQKIFGDFDDRTVMLVGAGETAETAAEHFESSGDPDFLVVNRSRETGSRLAERFDGEYRPLEQLEEALTEADIAVVATGAQEPLVTRPMLDKVVSARGHEALFLIDISNPRNVAPGAGDLPSVYLYNMDDLQSLVASNKAARREEIPAAEEIVDHYVEQWDNWMQQRQVTPTISTLARYFEDIRQQELSRHDGEISDAERSMLEAFSKGLVKKLLHPPISTLRGAVEDNSLSSEQLELIWSLYNLREFEEQTNED